MVGSTAKIIEKIAAHVNEDKVSFCQKIIDYFSQGIASLKANYVSLTSSGGRTGPGSRMAGLGSSMQVGGDNRPSKR